MQVNLPGLRIREWLQDPNCLLLHYLSSLSWRIQILKQRMHHWKPLNSMMTMYSTSASLKPILIEHPTQTKHFNAASKRIWLHHDFTSHARRGRRCEYTGANQKHGALYLLVVRSTSTTSMRPRGCMPTPAPRHSTRRRWIRKPKALGRGFEK